MGATTLALAIGAGAAGATDVSALTVGQASLAPNRTCTPPTVLSEGPVAGGVYNAGLAGSLTSFSTRMFDTDGGPNSFRLVVMRPTGGLFFTLVALGPTRVLPTSLPATAVTYAIPPIPVQVNDYIGVYISGSGSFYCDAPSGIASDTLLYENNPPVTTGSTLAMSQFMGGTRLSLAANLRLLTTLVAAPTSAPNYVLRATLRNSAGQGVPGQRITFSTPDGEVVCSATTNASGVATCSASSDDKTITGGYTATYAGTPTGYLPSTAHGTFTRTSKFG